MHRLVQETKSDRKMSRRFASAQVVRELQTGIVVFPNANGDTWGSDAALLSEQLDVLGLFNRVRRRVDLALRSGLRAQLLQSA